MHKLGGSQRKLSWKLFFRNMITFGHSVRERRASPSRPRSTARINKTRSHPYMHTHEAITIYMKVYVAYLLRAFVCAQETLNINVYIAPVNIHAHRDVSVCVCLCVCTQTQGEHTIRYVYHVFIYLCWPGACRPTHTVPQTYS